MKNALRWKLMGVINLQQNKIVDSNFGISARDRGQVYTRYSVLTIYLYAIYLN